MSSYRSDGLLHPASDAVTSLFLTALVAFVALLCALVARRGERGPRGRASSSSPASPPAPASRCFGKVLSPQFVIWVLPLGALAFAWRMHALAAAVALAAVLTQIEFPAHYFDVVAREPLAIGLVALRNVALAAVIALSVRELLRAGVGRTVGALGLRPSARRQTLAPGADLAPRAAAAARCAVARPSASASISTAFSHGSSSEVSKRTFVSVRKRSSASSRFTPITPPRGPVIPTSVT